MAPFQIDSFMEKARRRASAEENPRPLPRKTPDGLYGLLRLRGEAFLQAAYGRVLRRAPDATGMAAYLPRAYSLLGRLRVLAVLLTSRERGTLRRTPLLCCRTGWRRLQGLCGRFRQKRASRAELEGFYALFEDRFRYDTATIQEMQRQRYGRYLPEARRLGDAALDLGCGRGEWLTILGEAGFRAMGVDSNRLSVQRCRERGLTVREENLFRCLRRLPDDSQALVSAFHVVEHLTFPDIWRLVRECRRVLRPGGLLLLETPNARNPLVGAGEFWCDPTHLRPVFPDTLAFLMEHQGLAGAAYFFAADQTPLPAAGREPQTLEDGARLSRDVAWIGRKP